MHGAYELVDIKQRLSLRVSSSGGGVWEVRDFEHCHPSPFSLIILSLSHACVSAIAIDLTLFHATCIIDKRYQIIKLNVLNYSRHHQYNNGFEKRKNSTKWETFFNLSNQNYWNYQKFLVKICYFGIEFVLCILKGLYSTIKLYLSFSQKKEG